MSIKIGTLVRGNSQDPTIPPKYYAHVVNQGDITLADLSAMIARMSTASKNKALSVLKALTEVIPQQLEAGNVVHLGKLGSFSVSIVSSPSDNKEEVGIANIQEIILDFIPSEAMEKRVNAFAVRKASEE